MEFYLTTPHFDQEAAAHRLRTGPPLLVAKTVRLTKPMDMNVKIKSLSTGIGEGDLLREALRRGWLDLGFGDIHSLI